MRILIIGAGGREHALAWKCALSPKVTRVFVAPGNAGCPLLDKVYNVDIAANDIDTLVAFVGSKSVDLTIVGPEAPLVAGIADQLQAAGHAVFGPSAAAAELEASKSFTKDFLQRHQIPTARYRVFTDVAPAIDFIQSLQTPLVIKADGLAGGKGVVVAQTKKEAISATRSMLTGNAFGPAGKKVVIEEFLHGEEASFIAMVDGSHVLPLASSQDHKAARDGDTGPNTGGMGAYSPAAVVTEEVEAHIMQDIMLPTVAALAAEGKPFTGFLYAGLMIDKGRARVIEFNVRLGDPETQPLLMRLESDFVDLIVSALQGRLDQVTLQWSDDCAVGVVLAAGGYPAACEKGNVITGLPDETTQTRRNVRVFHAATAQAGDDIVTAGGRVLCVTALGESVKIAQANAYTSVAEINWADIYYRKDIGYRAIAREKQADLVESQTLA